MAAKFRIFCDEPASQQQQSGASGGLSGPSGGLGGAGGGGGIMAEKDKLANRREPLALRQHFMQEQPQPTSSPTPPTSQQQQHSDLDQDQENDISIASLGSDFVPSIINEEFDSFECEDESGNISDVRDGDDCHTNDFDRHMADEEFAASENDLLLCGDDDIELDDQQVQRELQAALKKHDESLLLNSAVFKDDIVDYLHDLEVDPDLRPTPNYMVFHHDIDSNKRAILINWLVEVTDEYELQTETLFICISIIDRFLSRMSINTSHLQLLGVAAMFIATKYEEIYPPYLYQFVEVTDETFSGKEIIQMEQEILRTLDFRISMPTMTYFLRQIFAYNKFTRKVFHLAEYLCHLSLLADRPFLEYLPSEIALAAVILAAHQLDAANNISSELRSAYDKSNLAQLGRRDARPFSTNKTTTKNSNSESTSMGNGMFARDNRQYVVSQDLPLCIESLRAMQERVSHDSAIYTKFSSETHDRVACLPPISIEHLQRCA